MKEIGEQQEWIYEATQWVLTRMGYDVKGNVNEQFLQRFHKELVENPAPKRLPPGRKKKPKKYN
jgi:hypothetical protein